MTGILINELNLTDSGQFLELSLPARDVAESLAWYRSLGFTEYLTTDVRHYHYAVVGAGDTCIGLHGGSIEKPGLSFVRPDVARYVRQEQDRGREFEFVAIGEDQFHEAWAADPDGTLAISLEARTFSSQVDSEKEIATIENIRLPCMRLEESRNFWQENGFIVVESEQSEVAELHAPGLTVELRDGIRQLSLVLTPTDPEACLERLEAAQQAAIHTPEGHELIAPEGTRLLIQDLPRS